MAKVAAIAEGFDEFRPVKTAFLHKAIMVGGKTEATITNIKVPGVKMSFAPGKGLFITYKGEDHFVPDAAINHLLFEK